MTNVAENIDKLVASLRRLELLYRRPIGSVKLLAVSKKQSTESITQANIAGLKDFGENYLQEALDKIEKLSQLDLCWHFIGPIQANKTRSIAEHFQWVHSIDRHKIAQRLNDHRPQGSIPLNVCVQINLSSEASKSGVTLTEAEDLCDYITQLPRLKLRGLMAIPAPLAEFDSQRACFRLLASEFARLQPLYPEIDTLSMGMSSDYEAAVAEGSTLLRIGTGIFGPRK